jgi:hypothetical protein
MADLALPVTLGSYELNDAAMTSEGVIVGCKVDTFDYSEVAVRQYAEPYSLINGIDVGRAWTGARFAMMTGVVYDSTRALTMDRCAALDLAMTPVSGTQGLIELAFSTSDGVSAGFLVRCNGLEFEFDRRKTGGDDSRPLAVSWSATFLVGGFLALPALVPACDFDLTMQIVDNFKRVNPTGWGPYASGGQTWNDSTWPGLISTDGEYGYAELRNGSAVAMIIVLSGSGPNSFGGPFMLRTRFKFDHVPNPTDGGWQNTQNGLSIGWWDYNRNSCFANLWISRIATGTYRSQITSTISGTGVNIDPAFWVVDTWYMLDFYYMPGVGIEASVWKASESRPDPATLIGAETVSIVHPADASRLQLRMTEKAATTTYPGGPWTVTFDTIWGCPYWGLV